MDFSVVGKVVKLLLTRLSLNRFIRLFIYILVSVVFFSGVVCWLLIPSAFVVVLGKSE